jgi:hypothetical protein
MAQTHEPEELRRGREAPADDRDALRVERRYDAGIGPDVTPRGDVASPAGPLVAFSGGALLLIAGAIAVAVVPFVGAIFLFMGLLVVASGFSRTVRVRSVRPRPPAPPRDGGMPTGSSPPSTA